MKNWSVSSPFSKLFQVLIIALLSIAVARCGGKDESKPVKRYNNNGQSTTGMGKLTKPTPETGVNAIGFATIGFTAMKEVSRVLDFALNGEKATAKNKCEKPEITKSEGKITYTISSKKCEVSSAQDEVIVVGVNANGGITSVARDSVTAYVGYNKTSRSAAATQLTGDIVITLKGNSVYSFTYKNGRWQYDMQAENRRNNNRDITHNSDASIELSGEIDLSNLNRPVVTAFTLDIAYSRLKDGKSALTTDLKIVGSDNMPLACGLPVGSYQVSQNFKSDRLKASEKPYAPTIQIRSTTNGKSSVTQIEAPQANDKLVVKPCELDMKSVMAIGTQGEHYTDRIPGAALNAGAASVKAYGKRRAFMDARSRRTDDLQARDEDDEDSDDGLVKPNSRRKN